MERVFTDKAPKAVGAYSQAIKSGGFVFTSGQLAVNENGAVEGNIKEQTERVLKNLAEILKEAGSDLRYVVKTTCYLADINDFSAFNEVYSAFFPDKPARTLVQAANLPKNARLELDAIAEIKG